MAFLCRSTLREFIFDIYILSLQTLQGLMMTLATNERHQVSAGKSENGIT